MLKVPRRLAPNICLDIRDTSLHVFADASGVGIGIAVYLRTVDRSGGVVVGFVAGESKLAPKGTTTIPRMELCAAVAATRTARRVKRAMSNPTDYTRFYTDSQVVLAYLRNVTAAFSLYVTRRVDAILTNSAESEWRYVPGRANPADYATRPSSPRALQDSDWLTGPEFLRNEHFEKEMPAEPQLTEDPPETLPGLRSVKTALTTVLRIGTHRRGIKGQRSPISVLYAEPKRWFTTWRNLLRLTSTVVEAIERFKRKLTGRSATIRTRGELEQ